MAKADTAGFEFTGRISGTAGKKYEMVKTVDGEKYTITIMDTDGDGFDAKDTIKLSKGNISVFAAEEVRKAVLNGIPKKGENDKAYEEADSRAKNDKLKEMPKVENGSDKLKTEANVEYTLESFMNAGKPVDAKDKLTPEANKTPENVEKKGDATGPNPPETTALDFRFLMQDEPLHTYNPGFGLNLGAVQSSSYADVMCMNIPDFGGMGGFGGGFADGFSFGAPIGGMFGLGGFGSFFGSILGGGAGGLGAFFGSLIGSLFCRPSYPEQGYAQYAPQQGYQPQEQYYPAPPEAATPQAPQAPAAPTQVAPAPVAQPAPTAQPAIKKQDAPATSTTIPPTSTSAPATAPTATATSNAAPTASAAAPAPAAAPAATPTGGIQPQEGTIEGVKEKMGNYSTKIDELQSKYNESIGKGSTYSRHINYLTQLNGRMATVEALNPTSKDYKEKLGNLDRDTIRAIEILDDYVKSKMATPPAAGSTPVTGAPAIVPAPVPAVTPTTAPIPAPAATSAPEANSCAPNLDAPPPADGVSVDGNSVSKTAPEAAPAATTAPAPAKAPNYTAQIMAFKDRALNGKAGDDFAGLVQEIVQFRDNTPNLNDGNKADLAVAEKMAIARRDAKPAQEAPKVPAPAPVPIITPTKEAAPAPTPAKPAETKAPDFGAQIKTFKDLARLSADSYDFAGLLPKIKDFRNNTPNLTTENIKDLDIAEQMATARLTKPAQNEAPKVKTPIAPQKTDSRISRGIKTDEAQGSYVLSGAKHGQGYNLDANIQLKSNPDSELRGLYVRNTVYNDLSGDLPEYAQKFKQAHEAEIKKLNFTLDSNGNIVKRARYASSSELDGLMTSNLDPTAYEKTLAMVGVKIKPEAKKPAAPEAIKPKVVEARPQTAPEASKTTLTRRPELRPLGDYSNADATTVNVEIQRLRGVRAAIRQRIKEGTADSQERKAYDDYSPIIEKLLDRLNDLNAQNMKKNS